MKFIFTFIFGIACVACIAQIRKDMPMLPDPYASKSTMNFSNVIGWKDGEVPYAPSGFKLSAYARDLENPRWIYVLPNGDVLVAESNSNHPFPEKVGAAIIGASKSNSMAHSADRITLLRDADHDGVVDSRTEFLSKLNQPFGMLLIKNWFYVANTDAIWRYPYQSGQTAITGQGEKIADLPAGKRHWARNIISNARGSKIYIAVGSGTNVAEDGVEAELLRANILEMDPDGKELKVFASGLRNPQGMGWSTDSTLWTSVNERDELGDDLVPDYLTHVEKGGFYGWPYVYFGQHADPRVKQPDLELVKKTIVPDVPLGSHTASLGLAFCTKKTWPKKYHNGVFIGQHGSWNRSVLSGYKVVFVPFKNGKPSGKPEDFLTGFIQNLEKKTVHGRPVGVTEMSDGSLLVADDVSNIVWKVTYTGKP